MPLRTTQRHHSTHESAKAIAKAIGTECGTAPTACPMRAFDDTFVGEVMAAHRMVRMGEHVHLAALAALCPPERLYRGVDFYERAVQRALAARRRREEAKRQNANASSRGAQRGRR